MEFFLCVLLGQLIPLRVPLHVLCFPVVSADAVSKWLQHQWSQFDFQYFPPCFLNVRLVGSGGRSSGTSRWPTRGPGA